MIHTLIKTFLIKSSVLGNVLDVHNTSVVDFMRDSILTIIASLLPYIVLPLQCSLPVYYCNEHKDFASCDRTAYLKHN